MSFYRDVPTGRSRHRVTEDGKLVLQIEEQRKWSGQAVYHRDEPEPTWRDATVEDVTTQGYA